jgi:phosphorylase/glycogen(starch) synthase
VSNAWDNVRIESVQQVDMGREAIMVGGSYHVEVVVDVDGLRPEDIGVELVIASQIDPGEDVRIVAKHDLEIVSVEGSSVRYVLDTAPPHAGSYDFALRVYPRNDKLPHRMDFALVKWI